MGAGVDAADGRPPAAADRRRGAARDRLLAAGRLRPGQVLPAARRRCSPRATTGSRELERTRDHTERMLRGGRGRAHGSPTARRCRRRPSPAAITIDARGRGSSCRPCASPAISRRAAFHLVAGAARARAAPSRSTGVGLNPTRVGLLGILNRMGARIEVVETGFEAGEPVGCDHRPRRRPERHQGRRRPRCRWRSTSCRCVALLGCFAEGETVVTGAEELRHKESDRIATVVDGLARARGRSIEALPDGFVVTGTGGLRGGTIAAAGDHRIAMLGAVAGLASRGGGRGRRASRRPRSATRASKARPRASLDPGTPGRGRGAPHATLTPPW